MCLYPRLIKNPKYKENKKNGGVIPAILDIRTTVVPVGCGNCVECMKQRRRAWQIRLNEDIRVNKNAKFVTLTFSNESYTRIAGEFETTGYVLDNQIATRAMRLFLERWRKKYKKSLRHWAVTEIGGTRYECIHIHGLLYTDEIEDIKKIWQYGHVWIGQYVNEKTINYVTKYMTKKDEKHKTYKPVILTSAGIGRAYTETYNSKLNKYKAGATKETYTTRDGIKLGMPNYWRNKIYTDDEREKLWIEKLDKQKRYVLGNEIDVSKNLNTYFEALKEARRYNIELGYGTDKVNWQQKEYEHKIRELKQAERILADMEKKRKEFEKEIKANRLAGGAVNQKGLD